MADRDPLIARLDAILAIMIDSHLRSHPEIARPRERSIDRLLHDIGLSQTEIAALLGKTQQAVSEKLKEGRAKA